MHRALEKCRGVTSKSGQVQGRLPGEGNNWSKHWLDREERHPDKASCIEEHMEERNMTPWRKHT